MITRHRVNINLRQKTIIVADPDSIIWGGGGSEWGGVRRKMLEDVKNLRGAWVPTLDSPGIDGQVIRAFAFIYTCKQMTELAGISLILFFST